MIQPVGYFKIWRELLAKPIWLNSSPEQKIILITLLAMANFRQNQWEWKGQKYECQPGQFITSLDKIVDECGKGVSVRNVRTALERFEKLEFLTSESTKTGRLITIVNWAIYQEDAEKPTKPLTKTRQRPDKDPTTKEKGNKDKKDIYIYVQHLPLTTPEYKKLVAEFGKAQVDEKIQYAENYAKLKNYKSIYLTLNNWLRKDNDENRPTPQQVKPIRIVGKVGN